MTEPHPDRSVPTVEQVSAGGVVYRLIDGTVQIAIVKISDELRWHLPKGLIDPGETKEQAALREVREESGIDGEIVGLIETIDYWFYAAYSGERRRYHKFVHFYLMHFVGGDVGDHDHEVVESRWVPVDAAIEMLYFKTERDVVTKAVTMIN
ncbi:MAG TPA: NUDIX hydrolase [Pyrinomonadaceae bacterium]|nr:NUDIX hydrolase [Pyrinomonadaceae bacterium]